MTFFPQEVMQRIRYLHFKIKHLDEALEKEEESVTDGLRWEPSPKPTATRWTT